MRYYLLIFLVLIAFNSNSQEVNEVSVIGNGFGSNENEAISSALRNSIEKAVGVFIVSSSEVVNDELVKDQINSVATGNILDYSVISMLKDGTGFKATVSANISPDKLVISLNNQVGSKFEVKGNVYAQNAIKEKFYQEQEPLIIKSLMDQYANVPFFDISVHMAEPKSILNSNSKITDFDSAMIGFNDTLTSIFKKKVLYTSETYLYGGAYGGEKKKLYKGEVHTGITSFYYEESLEEKKGDFFIDFLLLPKINKTYIGFIEGLIKMLNDISIKDINAYSKISNSPPVIISFSSIELISPDVIKTLKGMHQTIQLPADFDQLKNYRQKEILSYSQNLKGYFFYLRNSESANLIARFLSVELAKKVLGTYNFVSDFIDFDDLRFYNPGGRESEFYIPLCHENFWMLNRDNEIRYFYPFIHITEMNGINCVTFEPFIIRKIFTTDELNAIKSFEFKPLKN